MLMDILVQILVGLLVFFIPIIAGYVVAWLKVKLGNEKFAKVKLVVDVIVKAIEQRVGAGNGAEKKRQVELYLANKLKGVSPDDIDHVIEATVAEMNKATKGDK